MGEVFLYILMAQAPRDQNRIPTLLGASNADGITPVAVYADPSTHALIVSASLTPSGTQDVNLTKVGGTAFALGQQLAASALPVVLTAAQLSTLTPLSTVAATQSGTWNIGTVTTLSQFPAAAALSDSFANPTTTQEGAFCMVWDSVAATWKRSLTNKADGTALTVSLPASAPHLWGASNDIRPQYSVFPIGDGISAANTASVGPSIYDVSGATWSRMRGMVNAVDSVGTGIQATGILAQFDDTSPGTVTENRFGNIRMSVRREIYGQIRDAAGNERGANVDSNNNLGVVLPAETTKVIGTINIAAAQTLATVTTLTGTTTLTPGTAAANLGKAEDAVHSSGDVGVFSLGVANEAQTSLAGDGDYIAQVTDTKGNTMAVGNLASDAVDAGNPIKIGAQARSSEITAVSSADRVNLIADLVGKLIVLPYANPENFVSGAITSAMTGTTSTSLIAAPAAGLRNYITQITVSNSHATVGTDIIIQDGSGGTTLYVIPAAANYGGATLTFPTPLRQPTTATAIYCANVTTSSSTKVSASGYKGA